MNYSYISLSSLRSSGITKYTDNEAKKLIYLYSSRINRLLKKYFIPTDTTYLANGGVQMLKISESPIIKINSISILSLDGSRTALDPNRYKVIGNNLISFSSRLPEGLGNVEISCVLGEVENKKYLEVELTSAIKDSITSFTVTNSSGLSIGDVLVYEDYSFIINDIDYSLNEIYIDNPGKISQIDSGKILKTYGRVPYLIEEATRLFISNDDFLKNQKSGIKSEKIGNYSYVKTDEKIGFTGIEEIDNILSLFMDDNFEIGFL